MSCHSKYIHGSSCLKRSPSFSKFTRHVPIIKAETPKLPNGRCSRNNCMVSPPKRRIEKIMDPTPPPIIKRIVTRLPTPDPSIIEVVVKKPCRLTPAKTLPKASTPQYTLSHLEPQPAFTYTQPATCSTCIVSPPRKKTEIIRDPTPEPIIKRIVTRLKTPEPDIIERIIIKRQPQEIIETVTEQPSKPPPKIIERVVFHSVTPTCGCDCNA